MSDMPLVSIIIPVYNGSNYMAEAIESAISQTYPNLEIIVVNDGSTDDGKTEEIAMSYKGRIKYIKKENGGVSSALNCGIRNMSGEYFSWLSHDDVYAPQKIEKQMQVMQKCEKEDAIIVCLVDLIDKDSKVIKQALTHDHQFLNPSEALDYTIKRGINGCSLLIPKKAFSVAGMFDERLRYCQDILMWWKMILSGYSLVFCDYIGVHSRVHAGQLTRTGSAIYHHDARIIGDMVIPGFAAVSSLENNILYKYAKAEAIHGNKTVVSKCVHAAVERGLFSAKHRIVILYWNTYGTIRPIIRRIYYALFRNIKIR